MEIYRLHGTTYGVITENYKEKKELFKLIGKREPTATYYIPGVKGKREQFSVSSRESDLINEKLR